MKRQDYSPISAPLNPHGDEARAAMREYAAEMGVTVPSNPQRPPLTVPPDEVLQGGFQPAEDGTLTAYAAQRVTWVYRGQEWKAEDRKA